MKCTICGRRPAARLVLDYIPGEAVWACARCTEERRAARPPALPPAPGILARAASAILRKFRS